MAVNEKSLAEIERKLEAYLDEHPMLAPPLTAPAEPELPTTADLSASSLPADQASILDNIPIEFLRLSIRPHNALRRAGIVTVGQLAQMSSQQILDVRNVGRKGLDEIEEKLQAYLAESPSVRTGPITPAKPEIPTLVRPEPSMDLSLTTLDELIERWLGILSERERQVLCWRYGLDREPLKLEEIGRQLDLTRERVRQIEAKAIRKLYGPAQRYTVQPLVRLVRQSLVDVGGVSTEVQLGEVIAESTSVDSIDPQGVGRLLLNTHNDFAKIKGERAWGLANLSLDLVAEINRQAIALLAAEHAPLSKEELLARLKATYWYEKHADPMNDTFILACVNVSEKIVCRDNGCYELEKWERQYEDDIIVALRRLGRPAHYSEIAEIINTGLSLDQHITLRAVHTRLMQHPELFVWVGRRGTYGLKESGVERALSYVETLVRILRHACHPLTLQEILAQLPTLRPYYDETSIVFTLGTSERFRPFPSNTYGLTEWREDEFATPDYRLQRLFSGVEATISPFRPKPEVTEALDSVDRFIAQVRARANNGL